MSPSSFPAVLSPALRPPHVCPPEADSDALGIQDALHCRRLDHQGDSALPRREAGAEEEAWKDMTCTVPVRFRPLALVHGLLLDADLDRGLHHTHAHPRGVEVEETAHHITGDGRQAIVAIATGVGVEREVGVGARPEAEALGMGEDDEQ